jgi:hypothetical protein
MAHIIATYGTKTTRAIAEDLGRSHHGIRQLVQKLRLKRTAKQKSAIYRTWDRRPPSADKRPAMRKFPWNLVKSFKCASLADGRLIVTPEYDPERIRPYTEVDGGGPDVFLRMALAKWVEKRLKKKGSK